MPKATLEFSLPDEELAHRQALLGAEYRAVLAEMLTELRDRRKHRENPAPVRAVLDELWQALHDHLDAHGVAGEFT